MTGATSGRPIRVLIVDDDPTSLRLLRAALRRSGFDVTMAASGKEALSKFRAETFQLVMLDVSMPEMSGFEVCVTLRKEADPSLPIVMVTSLNDVISMETAFDCGATDFISKPINWELIGHRAHYLMRGHQALVDLRSANARNAAILQAIPDLLFEVDFRGRFLSVHSPHPNVLGNAPQDMVGKLFSEVLTPDAARTCDEAVQEAIRHKRSGGKQFLVNNDAGSFWLELSVALKETVSGQPSECIGLLRDITHRKADEQKILRLAMFDNLTGLPNRQSFTGRIEREIKRAHQGRSRFGVLFMDLDGFKTINDTMGHGAGDLALQWAAGKLREGVRSTDLVSRMDDAACESSIARLGGDEFTALVIELDSPEDVEQITHRILTLMRSPFLLMGREVRLSTSIGVAIYPEDGLDADTLLRNADTAMYHAKEAGRDTFKFYDRVLTEQVIERVSLERDLRAALAAEQFRLYFQPLVSVETGRISGVEVLLRWQRPGHGMVGPDVFIAAAERTGLIVPLGEWVLRTACSNAARWQAAGYELRVAVNLSPVQFRDPNLLHTVVRYLSEVQLPAHLLELELTESAVMQDTDATTQTLQALHSSGVHIALDDFGTGHSSLSYLQRMPLSRLKIDRSFVAGLPDDTGSYAIVKAIVSMASSLGLSITAEGVETNEQSRVLQDMGCQTLQGFYYGKPMPVDDMDRLLKRGLETSLMVV